MANRKYPYETDGPLKNIAAGYPGGINVPTMQAPKSAQQQANELLGQINNRPGFQYDPSTDPMWQNIRNQYIHNGQRAMEDTMGQAAGLTGGYGSTYAQGVGQQAYNEYLLGLNGELATAYDRARTAYDADTADLYNRYNLALGAAQDEYNRGRDALADERYAQEYADQLAYQQWQQQQAERDYADDQAYREWQMRQAELDRQDQQNKQSQNMAYEMVMNMISTGQTPPAELLAQAGVSGDYARSMAGYYAQQAALAAGYGGGSGGSGSGAGSGNGSGYGNISDAERQQILDYLLANGEQKGQSYLQRYANYDNFDAVRQWIIAEYNRRKRQEALNSKPKGNGGGGSGSNNRDNRLN